MSYTFPTVETPRFFAEREKSDKERVYRNARGIEVDRQIAAYVSEKMRPHGVHETHHEDIGKGCGAERRVVCSCGWRGEWRGEWSSRNLTDLWHDRENHLAPIERWKAHYRYECRVDHLAAHEAGLLAVMEYERTMDGRGLA